MALIGLILSILGLLFCVYLYLELLKKLSVSDTPKAFQSCSEELSKTYAKSLRDIETEWADMYLKFSRLAGRIDKTKALDNQGPAPAVVPIVKRSDLLRKHRGGVYE